ncbi:MAG: hypothetical protein ACI37V_02945 [Methanobrevibacter sp.]
MVENVTRPAKERKKELFSLSSSKYSSLFLLKSSLLGLSSTGIITPH